MCATSLESRTKDKNGHNMGTLKQTTPEHKIGMARACLCIRVFVHESGLSSHSSILMLSTIVPAYQTAPTFPRFHSGNPSRVRAKAGHTGADGGAETRGGGSRVCVQAYADVNPRVRGGGEAG